MKLQNLADSNLTEFHSPSPRSDSNRIFLNCSLKTQIFDSWKLAGV